MKYFRIVALPHPATTGNICNGCVAKDDMDLCMSLSDDCTLVENLDKVFVEPIGDCHA